MIASSLQTEQSISQQRQKKLFRYTLPIPSNGIHEQVLLHYAKDLPVSVVPVLCRSEQGQFKDPVLEIALVEHTKGGGHMLPQGKYGPRDTPYEAATALLLSELNLPKSELKFVTQSCVLVAFHEHSVPVKRRHHLSEVGKEENKLLVFIKVCVNEKFTKTQHEDIKKLVWVDSLAKAKRLMRGMRSELKYLAELEAIQFSTNWVN